jgi:hypothetical protein
LIDASQASLALKKILCLARLALACYEDPMSTFQITLHVVAVFCLAWLAMRFRWKVTPSARQKMEAFARGKQIVSAHRSALTWGVRAMALVGSVYLCVSLVQKLVAI